jgi:2-oxoglutarate ferredoxin oxidoreductase subunit beta
MKAFEKSLEWGEKIPNGIFYKYERDIFEERTPAIQEKPLVKQKFSLEEVKREIEKFY